ncbi:MAG: hypothetical protein NTY07_20275 [Bacteroidia bacterium]|nr:hypothetical protein [Bacteroidia bacterium]
MRTLYLIGMALITFLLGNSFTISPYSQKKETQKTEIKVCDADWENLHLMIELYES